MKIHSMYSVKIKHYNRVFNETARIYREAVDFFIQVALTEWEALSKGGINLTASGPMESLTVKGKKRASVKYDFSNAFYKFPCYLRRAAIREALGKVSSYKSNLANWEKAREGNEPSFPKAGYIYPAMYRGNMFEKTGKYTGKVKVYIRNTWDWLYVNFRKSDIDYIERYCKNRKECVPTLQKRGKEWFLDFAFEEKVELSKAPADEQRIVAVDLGLNNACVCSVMSKDGTILGRRFLSLPREQDCLAHSIGRIKKAQQHGARKTPRLWAKAKGINDDIAVKTAQFIIDTAVLYSADVIVFEHLDRAGKKHGASKQKLHHWKSQYVQEMVTHKAHRMGVRISRICAWGTSKYAYDGSGVVVRDKDNYSMCTFSSGKRYHCDLSASYNIGARYFIREILKSLPETARLDAEAKVPQCAKRRTCTYSTLISLNAVLAA